MKRIVLLLLGFIPFLLGRLMDWSMMTIFYDTALPYFLIGVAVLLLWFVVAYIFGGCAENPPQAAFLLNLAALLVLILLGIQELVLHAYWMNAAGMWTQMFFLPVLNIGFWLTSWSHSVFPAYCAAFALMIAVSLPGFTLRQRRKVNMR